MEERREERKLRQRESGWTRYVQDDRNVGGEEKRNEVQQDDVHRCVVTDCVIIGWTTGAGPVDYVRRRRVSGVSYDSW